MHLHIVVFRSALIAIQSTTTSYAKPFMVDGTLHKQKQYNYYYLILLLVYVWSNMCDDDDDDHQYISDLFGICTIVNVDGHNSIDLPLHHR